jgi:peptidoglycan/LPS O-acetylase OafA/YrhL
VPVVVVDEPPGADEMPADPGLAGGVPTGGTPAMPGAMLPCAAPAALVPWADAPDAADSRNIEIKAERYNLCRMGRLQFWSCVPSNVKGIAPFLPAARGRDHIDVCNEWPCSIRFPVATSRGHHATGARMTSISPSVAAAEVRAAPKARSRNAAIDHARTFLTLVVLLHHAVIPYTHFGHTDPKSWIGFDAIVLATDSFFMAMFFFMSGLFVWPSLARKTAGVHLRDRLLRLGLPFAIAAFTIIPIAYYALELQQQPDLGFAAFWWKTVTVGPWPSGPLWFVWVLLAFDLTASLLYRLSPNLVDPINRLSQQSFDQPAKFFVFLLAVTVVLYVPPLVYYTPNHWFEFGPFSVQASRVLLYAAYFFIGVGVGAANVDRGVLGADGQLAKSSWGWLIATLVPYCLMWVLIYIKREILGNPNPQPPWYLASYGLFFVAFSAAILFAILAFFLGSRRPWNLLDRMQGDAYGMFLVHYPIVLWLQYWLFDYDLPAIVKAAVAFIATVILSWALTAALRKIPGATRVL